MRVVLICLLLAVWPTSQASAKDVRLALLVANQYGWRGDPVLRYAIQGDLKPMAQALRRLGFQVEVLSNQGAPQLRKTFRALLKRLARGPRITTFLFYYSGHADQRHLHLGPRQKKPLSYKEFARWFKQVRVIRKFAIFDACFSGEIIRLLGSLSRYRAMLRRGQNKGIQRQTSFDISKLKIPNQGNERGVRVISSSIRLSWELHRYKASVFTHYLLKGLKGEADLDRDGKISMDELFDFTSRHVKKETGQKPEQLIIAQRGNPYALAPAYKSQLSIQADVIGKLRISIGNFVWLYHKKRRRQMLLSVVDGKGEVLLSNGRECWRQQMRFPKQGLVRLRRWRKVRCKRFARIKKGSVQMSAAPRTYDAFQPPRFLTFEVGGAHLGAPPLQHGNVHLGAHLRWHVLQLGLVAMTGPPPAKSFWLSRFSAQLALGWPFHLFLGNAALQLYLAGFGQLGVAVLHNDRVARLNPTLAAGGLFALSWWLSPRLGVQLGSQIGANFTPTQSSSGLSLQLQAHLGLTWAF